MACDPTDIWWVTHPTLLSDGGHSLRILQLWGSAGSEGLICISCWKVTFGGDLGYFQSPSTPPFWHLVWHISMCWPFCAALRLHRDGAEGEMHWSFQANIGSGKGRGRVGLRHEGCSMIGGRVGNGLRGSYDPVRSKPYLPYKYICTLEKCLKFRILSTSDNNLCQEQRTNNGESLPAFKWEN